MTRLATELAGFKCLLHLIIFREGDDKDDGLNTFEAVEPFLAFRPLPSDVDHVDSHSPGQK